MKKYFFLFLLFFPIYLNGQSDADTRARMIDGLVKYRHDLIAGDIEKIAMTSFFHDLYKIFDDDTEAVRGFFKKTNHEKLFYKDTSMLHGAEKEVAVLYKMLGMEGMKTIMEQPDFFDLLSESALKYDPPFKINSNTVLFEEMAFYKIKNGMRIAEIGAGKGTWGVLLGLSNDSLEIYVNEIEEYYIDKAKNKTKRCRHILPNNHYHFKLGNKKSTKLEGGNLDKIIIRNSFHHFSKNEKMLSSIKKSIKPDGDLYIFDPLKNVIKNKKVCPKSMVKEDLFLTIQLGGFTIVEEKVFDVFPHWVMLHCKPIQN